MGKNQPFFLQACDSDFNLVVFIPLFPFDQPSQPRPVSHAEFCESRRFELRARCETRAGGEMKI